MTWKNPRFSEDADGSYCSRCGATLQVQRRGELVNARRKNVSVEPADQEMHSLEACRRAKEINRNPLLFKVDREAYIKE